MTRNEADKVIESSLDQIYGFSLKRCRTPQDAEDVAQEIALRFYKSLIIRDDIMDTSAFLWAIAHNTLSNYYRDMGRLSSGVPIEDVSDVLLNPDSEPIDDIIAKETQRRLRSEIAYLSKLQRRIVIAYYFENMKLQSIAEELSIPLGTVKWHLFEAKKDLKRSIDTMRKTDDLKFNPIRFCTVGGCGSFGTKGCNSSFLRSSLAQNIVYSVYREAKTVNEIADDLGVSPVYVENEAEYLAEYGFLLEKSGRYISNVFIDESDEELIAVKEKIYGRAAKLFADELFDALTSGGILSDDNIWGGRRSEKDMAKDNARIEDYDNFLLWSLIPYITANSGKELFPNSIRFEEVSTVRPDGGNNICIASILSKTFPEYYDSMSKCNGPCWNTLGNLTLWQYESEWTDKRVDDNYQSDAMRILSLLGSEGELSEESYAFLVQKGIINVDISDIGIRTSFKCIWLEGNDIVKKLLDIGTAVKKKHFDELSALRNELSKAVLARTPKHLTKVAKYLTQTAFLGDGWFIFYCIKELLNSGKLKIPAEENRGSLTTLIIDNI